MRLKKILLIFLLIFTLSLTCAAQDAPQNKAVLFDKLTELDSCGEYLAAKLYSFSLQLLADPAAQGYIVIYGEKGSRASIKYQQEGRIKNHLARVYRPFPFERLNFLHGEDLDKLEIQFWTSPPGAEKPAYIEANWDYRLPQKAPFYIFKSYGKGADDGTDTCFNIIDSETYAKLLLANPRFTARIAIYEDSAKDFRRVMKDVSRKLTKQYNVPQKRLKFIRRKGSE